MIAWLGRRDSNPRMPGPKPGALPLGDGPSLRGASVLYHACESGSIARSLSGLRFILNVEALRLIDFWWVAVLLIKITTNCSDHSHMLHITEVVPVYRL